MTAQVNPVQQKNSGGLDDIANALNIAVKVYGVKVDADKAKALDELSKQKFDSEQNKESIKTATEQAKQQDQKVKDEVSFNKDWTQSNQPGGIQLPGRDGLWLPRSELDRRDKLAIEKDKSAKEKMPTPDEKTYAIFGKRLENSDNILQNLESDPKLNLASYGSAIQRMGIYPEALKSDKIKLYEQAQRDFVNAILRKESGSAISDKEFESARSQYFPSAGDSPEVLAQKQANRALAKESYKASAGNAWDKIATPQNLAAAKKKIESDAGTAQAGTDHPPVMQGGHLYHWNSKTGGYE